MSDNLKLLAVASDIFWTFLIKFFFWTPINLPIYSLLPTHTNISYWTTSCVVWLWPFFFFLRLLNSFHSSIFSQFLLSLSLSSLLIINSLFCLCHFISSFFNPGNFRFLWKCLRNFLWLDNYVLTSFIFDLLSFDFFKFIKSINFSLLALYFDFLFSQPFSSIVCSYFFSCHFALFSVILHLGFNS